MSLSEIKEDYIIFIITTAKRCQSFPLSYRVTAEPSVSVGVNCFARSPVNLSFGRTHRHFNWLRLTKECNNHHKFTAQENVLLVLYHFNFSLMACLCHNTQHKFSLILPQYPTPVPWANTVFCDCYAYVYVSSPFDLRSFHFPACLSPLTPWIPEPVWINWTGLQAMKRTNQPCQRISLTFNFLLDVRGSASSISSPLSYFIFIFCPFPENTNNTPLSRSNICTMCSGV